jgi:hypothetical protein
MYQSLHTTVLGSEGIPFEVQIRTWEMHQTAEYGIAAHWKYKEGIVGSADEEKFAWIRRLLEAQQDSDAQDFFQTLKIDMFSDEVFVFTPRGDVVNLPAGATPIDFAYSITFRRRKQDDGRDRQRTHRPVRPHTAERRHSRDNHIKRVKRAEQGLVQHRGEPRGAQ